MTVETQNVKGDYEIRVKLLNTEIVSVGLSSSNLSNRWVVLSSLVLFCTLTLLGAYGDKLINLYNMVAK
jgi:hypothetical protein